MDFFYIYDIYVTNDERYIPAVLGLQFASVAVNLAVGAADGADLVFTAGDVARLGGGAVMQSHRHDVLSARSPLHLAHRSNRHQSQSQSQSQCQSQRLTPAVLIYDLCR